jgi:hypothetical protein
MSTITTIAKASLTKASAFVSANRTLRQLATYFLALAAAMAALSRLGARVKHLFPGCPDWLWIIFAFLPLLTTFATQTLPTVIQRFQAFSNEQINAFRLTAYQNNEEDRTRFTRADRQHEKILDWLCEARHAITYLTSVSGAGKTSLLQAFVIPKLKDHEIIAIPIRGFEAPLEALKTALLTKDAVWEKPPKDNLQILDLLGRAAAHLGSRRLLLIFDQFEEYLLSNTKSSVQRNGMQSFLLRLGREPFKNVAALVVLRVDYIPLWLDFDHDQMLPAMTAHENWMILSAFCERDARKFISSSGLELGDILMNRLFRHLQSVEESDGLIRPITLNMAGLILDRHSLSSRTRILGQTREGFIDRYVRESLGPKESRRLCKLLISPNRDDTVTKRPRTVSELSGESGLPRSSVLYSLNAMSYWGLVRSLSIDGETWEISHDFVATVIKRVLTSWYISGIQVVRKIGFVLSLAVWGGIFLGLPRVRPVRMSDVAAQVELSGSEQEMSVEIPPFFGSGHLRIYSENRQHEELHDGPSFEADRDKGVETQMSGESGERFYDAIAPFSGFYGTLGRLLDPDFRKTAVLKGELEWTGNSTWESSGGGYNGSIYIRIDGVTIATLTAEPLITQQGRYHDMPWRYIIRFSEGR